MLYELLRKLDDELKHEVCHWAAYHVSPSLTTTHNCWFMLIYISCELIIGYYLQVFGLC